MTSYPAIIAAASATLSERKPSRMGTRIRASALACTWGGAPADSRPKRMMSHAAKAKYWMTELQGRACDLGIQLHGGYGYMAEYPISRAWADARVQRIYGGTNEIMLEIVARSFLGRAD